MTGYLWHLDPLCQNLLESEMAVLRAGLYGDFEFVQEISHGNNVIVMGRLSYAVEKTHAIQIIFPTKYPYGLPRVICGEILDDNGNYKFKPTNYQKGNQYTDGSMCLMRPELWDKREHNIGWLLRRAQEWLIYATSETGFPKDKIVEEYPLAFRTQGQVVLPKRIVPPDGVIKGELLLTQFKPNYYIHQENMLPAQVFSLELGKEAFRWYSLSGYTIADIGKLFVTNPNEFLSLFPKFFGEQLPFENGPLNIGFHLPDDKNQWHFMKLILNGTKLHALYYLGRTVENELFLRTNDIFDTEILKGKTVTIIGLGALGSEVAKSLGSNGVGVFNLFDNDTFEIGNVIRHAADLFYLGEHKVNVAKRILLLNNPNILVNEFNVDVLNDNGILESALSKSDLCIVLTGEESVDYLINDIYTKKYDIPFVFSGVSKGAVSGSIQVVHNKKTACLRCLLHAEADYLPKAKLLREFRELPAEYGSCSHPPLPGSEIDTKEVALQVARISLQLLFERHNSNYAPRIGDQYYWHGPYGSETFVPFTWEVKTIPIHNECKNCN